MLTVEVDSRQIMARLSAMPDKLRAAFLKKTYALAEKLKSKVQQNLTNKLLNIRTGKHSNDHMYSFYFRTPSGWMIEYGWGARNATYQSEYFTQDIYGHQPEDGGFGPMPEQPLK